MGSRAGLLYQAGGFAKRARLYTTISPPQRVAKRVLFNGVLPRRSRYYDVCSCEERTERVRQMSGREECLLRRPPCPGANAAIDKQEHFVRITLFVRSFRFSRQVTAAWKAR